MTIQPKPIRAGAEMQENADGSRTSYVQKSSPGPRKASNALPAPDGPW